MKELIVIYDGNCHLCNRLIAFLMFYDDEKVLKFSSSDSEFIKSNYPSISNWAANGLFVIEDGLVLSQADAVMAITQNVKRLGFARKVLSLFSHRFRLSAYRLVADNRYRLFGKAKKCDNLNVRFPNRFIS